MSGDAFDAGRHDGSPRERPGERPGERRLLTIMFGDMVGSTSIGDDVFTTRVLERP